MTNNKKTFILYKYNDYKKDYEYIKEYYTTKELLKDQNIILKNKKSVYNFIYKSIDDTIKHYLKDQFIIINELI